MNINTLDSLASKAAQAPQYTAFVDNGKVVTFLPSDAQVPDALKSYSKVTINAAKHQELLSAMNVSDKDVKLNADGSYVASDKPNEYHAPIVRTRRSTLLSATDWIVTRQQEASLSGETFISADDMKSLTAYRQALRDVSKQAGFPKSVVWPVIPAAVASLLKP